MLDSLFDNGLITPTGNSIKNLKRSAENLARKWAIVSAIICTVSVILIFLFVFNSRFFDKYLLVISSAVAGYFGGLGLGRAAAYGRLGHLMDGLGLSIAVVTGHPDRVGGMRPLGNFYLYYGVFPLTAVLWLSIWWVIIPAFGSLSRYSAYQLPFFGLWLVALAFLVVICVLPMLHFRRLMQQQKRALTNDTLLGPMIGEARSELAAAELPVKIQAAHENLERLLRYKTDIEELPTWPLAPDIRRKFTVGNMLLAVVPFSADIVIEKSEGYSSPLSFLFKFMKSLF